METYLLNHLLDAFAEFSQTVAPVVVTALWQGAILAVRAVVVSAACARRASAAHRFWIWAAGFVVVCWVAVFANADGEIIDGAVAFAGLPLAALRRAEILRLGRAIGFRLDLRWSLAIGAFWIAASVFRAMDLGIHSLRLRRLWKTAPRPVERPGYRAFPGPTKGCSGSWGTWGPVRKVQLET